jgi:hypothetical protein
MRLVSTKLLNEYNAAQKGRGCWPSDRPGRSHKKGKAQREEETLHNRLKSESIHLIKPSLSTPTQHTENSNHAD